MVETRAPAATGCREGRSAADRAEDRASGKFTAEFMRKHYGTE